MFFIVPSPSNSVHRAQLPITHVKKITTVLMIIGTMLNIFTLLVLNRKPVMSSLHTLTINSSATMTSATFML